MFPTRRTGVCTLAVLLGAACLAPPARALYVKPDLERVPVERLVANLGAWAAKDEKDFQVRYNLARLHGMAYAQKTDTVETWKGKDKAGAWFGYEPAHVPFKVAPAADEAARKAARAHLDKAIAAYKAVLKINPDYLPAQLGLAWTTEQAGDKVAAVAAYRDAIKNGWERESKLKSGPLGGRYITTEAAGYLIPLLDAEKDREEIKTLQDRVAHLKKLPRPVTPVAVPLRPGLGARDIEDAGARVRFDADGTGLAREWTWIRPDAGWLVHDPHGTGRVASALQLFGGVTFWLFWENGYQALAALDDDRDGLLAGDELKGLALWHDANANGVSEPGEVRPLAEHGIVALSVRYRHDPDHPDRIAFAPEGARFRDGSVRPTFDLILKGR